MWLLRTKRNRGGHRGLRPENKALKAKADPPGSGVGSRVYPLEQEVSMGTPARYRSAN